MSISESLIHDIRTQLLAPHCYNYFPYLGTNDISKYAYHKGIQIDVDCNNPIFIPSFNVQQVLFKLESINTSSNSKFIIPLQVKNIISHKTSNTIIKDMLKGADNHIISVNVDRRDLYFVGSGIILDSNWNIMLLCGYNLIYKEDKYKINESVCYISPEVFMNTDALSKYIVSKVIPVIANYNIDLPGFISTYKDTDVSLGTLEQVNIYIKDISNMFVSPVSYSENTDYDKEIWECIDKYMNKEE